MPTAKLRKSGNSVVLVVPPDLLKQQQLAVGEIVEYLLVKKADLGAWFGKGKHLNINAQKAKDMVRKEW